MKQRSRSATAAHRLTNPPPQCSVLADQGTRPHSCFTRGQIASTEGVDLVRRAAAEGHQMYSHSFKATRRATVKRRPQLRRRGSGRQREYGRLKYHSTSARSPYIPRTRGRHGEGVVRNVQGRAISAEIGWNIPAAGLARQPRAAICIANQVKRLAGCHRCSRTTEATDGRQSRRSRRAPISSRRATASSPWTSCSAIRSPKPRYCRSPDELR